MATIVIQFQSQLFNLLLRFLFRFFFFSLVVPAQVHGMLIANNKIYKNDFFYFEFKIGVKIILLNY